MSKHAIINGMVYESLRGQIIRGFSEQASLITKCLKKERSGKQLNGLDPSLHVVVLCFVGRVYETLKFTALREITLQPSFITKRLKGRAQWEIVPMDLTPFYTQRFICWEEFRTFRQTMENAYEVGGLPCPLEDLIQVQLTWIWVQIYRQNKSLWNSFIKLILIRSFASSN